MKTGQMMTKQHRTHAATTKTVNDLWCYQCNTLDDGDSCTNLTDPNGNYTNFRYKCEDENRICMVRHLYISYLLHISVLLLKFMIKSFKSCIYMYVSEKF